MQISSATWWMASSTSRLHNSSHADKRESAVGHQSRITWTYYLSRSTLCSLLDIYYVQYWNNLQICSLLITLLKLIQLKTHKQSICRPVLTPNYNNPCGIRGGRGGGGWGMKAIIFLLSWAIKLQCRCSSSRKYVDCGTEPRKLFHCNDSRNKLA